MNKLEKLAQKNKVDAIKGKTDKERIKELEQENAELMDAVIELATIVAGGE